MEEENKNELFSCEECGDKLSSNEVWCFCPENSSKTVRVCETCYDRLDEEERIKKGFYS